MRYTAAGLAFCTLAFFTQVSAQEQPKHLLVATLNGPRPLAVTALGIERSEHYGGIIRLKGAVEIRTPVCVPGSRRGRMTCDGEMILRADEADLHEDTGEIQARGNVNVTRVRQATR